VGSGPGARHWAGGIGSEQHSRLGFAAHPASGRDHNCFHGDGDGGGPAVRGVRVSRDLGGDRRSRAGACGMGAVEGRAQAGLRGAPRSWQMVPAVRGGCCRERQGRGDEGEQIEAAFHEPYTYVQVHTAGLYDDAGFCERSATPRTATGTGVSLNLRPDSVIVRRATARALARIGEPSARWHHAYPLIVCPRSRARGVLSRDRR
jgi:hypothetical protein